MTDVIIYLRRGDECLKALSHMTEWALPEQLTRASGNPAPPAAMANGEGDMTVKGTRYRAAFNRGLDTELGYFPWLELPENEGRLVRFGHAMVGTRQCEVENEILQGTASVRVSSRYMRDPLTPVRSC